MGESIVPSETPRLKARRVRTTAQMPQYMTRGAAGLDLASAEDAIVTINPGQRALVPTGIAVELPPGHEGQVRPRSGLAVKLGLTVLNGPGTIDEDYRGEIKVPLINLGSEAVDVQPGMRIAQLVVAPVTRVIVEEVDSINATRRSDGGFGHTG